MPLKEGHNGITMLFFLFSFSASLYSPWKVSVTERGPFTFAAFVYKFLSGLAGLVYFKDNLNWDFRGVSLISPVEDYYKYSNISSNCQLGPSMTLPSIRGGGGQTTTPY